jgi:hypothetical protein
MITAGTWEDFPCSGWVSLTLASSHLSWSNGFHLVFLSVTWHEGSLDCQVAFNNIPQSSRSILKILHTFILSHLIALCTISLFSAVLFRLNTAEFNAGSVHHSPSQCPLTIWWKHFLNVVCACKQKCPEPVRIFITPIGFWGLGYECNSWTFAHTVGQQQGSVSKEQPIVGQPVVERLCTHCTTSHKHCIDRAPTLVRDAKKQTSLRLEPLAWASISAHQVVLPIDHLTLPKLNFFLVT